MLGQTYPAAVYRRDGAVSRKGDADCLREAVHAVGCVHSRTGTAARTSLLFELQQLVIVDDVGFPGPYGFEHFGKAGLLAIDQAGHHRAAGTYYCRDVYPYSTHYHSGNDLVAVRNQH